MRKHRTRRLQHSTTFHCSEDFCSTTIRVRTLLPPCYAPNKVQKKRTQRNPPPFYLSRFQGEPRLPRVGYLNLTTGLMATTPFPGVTRSQTHRLAAHCVVLFFLPLWEALTSLSFHLTVAHSPLSSPVLINLVLISLRPRTGVLPYSQRLYAGLRRSHSCTA